MGLKGRKIIKTEEDFFINEFQREIYKDTFQVKNQSLFQRFKELSEFIFKDDVSEEGQKSKELLYEMLKQKQIVLGGRILANLGIDELKNVKPFNCYASQRNSKPNDSLDCIFDDLKIAAKILKSEGGIGFNFSHLRPRSTYIKGVGISTPGVVSFMEIYDKTSDIITRGSFGEELKQTNNGFVKKKVRKGAMISILECWHPDTLEYIESKKVANKLTKFNISVGITNDFMDAVVNDLDWNFIFPNIHHPKYDDEWNGNIKEWINKGYDVVIYKTVKARDVWNLIIDTSYNRNEPGLYFIDNAERYNNLSYHQRITGVNPCGEISMLGDAGVVEIDGVLYEYMGDICNLGSINWSAFVYYDEKEKKVKFLIDDFKKAVKVLVRTLDNIIDIKDIYPMEGIRVSAWLKRKIGCGNLGYASTLYMLGLRYGSDDANKFTEMVQKEYTLTAYKTSVELAKEKGKFPLCDNEKIINNGFIKNSGVIPESLKDEIRKYGLRNSALLTTAPTGNTSSFIFTSSGIEPVFNIQSGRWVNVNHKLKKIMEDEGKTIPNIAFDEWFETDYFKFDKMGDEDILMSIDGRYMIDKNRGLCKFVEIEEYGYLWCKENLPEEQFKEYEKNNVFVTTQELNVRDHLEPFKIFSKYIDNSISKTVNLPKEYPKSDFNDLYIEIWKSGCRGLTVYRNGTMTSVLDVKRSIKNKKDDIESEQNYFYDIWEKHKDNVVIDDVKLPSEYPMQGFEIRSEGKKWRLHVAFKDKKMTKPFAIFVNTNNIEPTVNTSNAIELLEKLAETEGIPQKFIDETRRKYAYQSNVTKIARVLGLLLRHNVDIVKIVKTLDNVDNIHAGSFVYRIKKFLMRYISDMENGKKCPECGETLVLKEGCETCPVCNYSKC